MRAAGVAGGALSSSAASISTSSSHSSTTPSSSSIRVAVRVRPLLPQFESNQHASVHTDGDTIVVLRQPDSTEAIYSFDSAFDSEDDANSVFNNIGLLPHLAHFLSDPQPQTTNTNKHIGVCSYGAVGTGKTQSILLLVEHTARHLLKPSTSSPLKSLIISYVQIKDKVNDLLGSGMQDVRLRDVPQLGFQPDGLVEMEVFTCEQLMQIIQHCKPAVHSCLFIKHPTVRGRQIAFVDLAYHPSSLLTFTVVMESLANKSTHARFRDSKLTMLLQPYLQDFTILLACVSPSPQHVLDTQQTLSFATKTKLHSLQSNAELLHQIDLMRNKTNANNADHRPLSEELKTQRLHNDLRRLVDQYKANKFAYDKMEQRIATLAQSNRELFDAAERRTRELALAQQELVERQDLARRAELSLANAHRQSQDLVNQVKREAHTAQALLELKIKHMEREQLDQVEKSTQAMLLFETKLQDLSAKHEQRLHQEEVKDKLAGELRVRAERAEAELALAAGELAAHEERLLLLNQSVAGKQAELVRAEQELDAVKRAAEAREVALAEERAGAVREAQAAAAREQARLLHEWEASAAEAAAVAKRELADFQLEERDTTRLLLHEMRQDFDQQLRQAQQDAQRALEQHQHAAEAELAHLRDKAEEDCGRAVEAEKDRLVAALADQAAQYELKERAQAEEAERAVERAVQAAREEAAAAAQAEAQLAYQDRLHELQAAFQHTLDETSSKSAQDSARQEDARLAAVQDECERRMQDMEAQFNEELGELERTIKDMQRDKDDGDLPRVVAEQHLVVAQAENKLLQSRVLDQEAKHREETRRLLGLLELAKKDLLADMHGVGAGTLGSGVDATDTATAAVWIAKFKHSEIKLFELQRRMEDDRRGAGREMDQLRANNRDRSGSAGSTGSTGGGVGLPYPPASSTPSKPPSSSTVKSERVSD